MCCQDDDSDDDTAMLMAELNKVFFNDLFISISPVKNCSREKNESCAEYTPLYLDKGRESPGGRGERSRQER